MAGWEVRWSKSRQRAYFYNVDSSESTWTPPEGLTDDDISKLDGAELLTTPLPAAGSSSSSPSKVQASHLLVKHEGSRRPSSWKEAKITRTKAQAIDILKGHEDALKALPAGEQRTKRFGELAKTESDCSSHSNNGDLGPFGRGQMQKPFEEAAFGLGVGDMSSIIETDSGVHLVLRTA